MDGSAGIANGNLKYPFTLLTLLSHRLNIWIKQTSVSYTVAIKTNNLS
jgi:hypothetical protein